LAPSLPLSGSQLTIRRSLRALTSASTFESMGLPVVT
jgi:hypothetical protein